MGRTFFNLNDWIAPAFLGGITRLPFFGSLDDGRFDEDLEDSLDVPCAMVKKVMGDGSRRDGLSGAANLDGS